jgi:hypothetical protein
VAEDEVWLLLRHEADLAARPRSAQRWRTVLLAANLAATVAVGVYAVLIRIPAPPPPVAPAQWVWTSPDSGLTYRCVLSSTDDPLPTYTCTPWR